jgi:hypothetical protein
MLKAWLAVAQAVGGAGDCQAGALGAAVPVKTLPVTVAPLKRDLRETF